MRPSWRIPLIGLCILGLAYIGWQFWIAEDRSTELMVVASPSQSLSESPSLSPSPSLSTSPSSQTSTAPTSPQTATIPTLQKTVLGAVHLSVPFTIQAPDGDWVDPWDEGCEEAALLMAVAYDKGDRSANLPVEETKQKILNLVNWQKERFGSHRDISAEEMAIIAREYMGYTSVRVVHNASLEAMRAELDKGIPVMVPAYGQKLGNPYFKQPGPPYHAFVLIGYDGNTFIANENGTRRGKDYRYSSDVLQTALRDVVGDGSMTYLVLK